MSIDNNIILITNDNRVVEILKPKLVLLREVDSILSLTYDSAIEKLEEFSPESVLIYCSCDDEDNCLNLIRKIKTNVKTKSISILIVLEALNEDFILSAYDEGITDYMQIKQDSIEVLVRTIWSFQKNAQIRTLTKQTNLLKRVNVLDKTTGFYKNAYFKDVYENETSILNELSQSAVFMLIALSQESKTTVSFDNFVSAINTSIRNSDVVIHGVNDRFYILLTKTQLKSAFFILEKIKKALGNQAHIIASVADIKNYNSEEIDKLLLAGLCEAETTGEDLIIINESEKKDESAQDWIDKINSSPKNFKLFKQAFSKKLEKVISPIFFQMQKIYEEKLFETSIEQYCTSTVSEFVLKNNDKNSVLRITYPGFSKINIDYIHQGFDAPENERISLDLADLTEDKLTQIINKFIKEFKANLSEE